MGNAGQENKGQIMDKVDTGPQVTPPHPEIDPVGFTLATSREFLISGRTES